MSETQQTDVFHTPYSGGPSEALSAGSPPVDSRGVTFLQMRQKERARALAAYYDPMADKWEEYRQRNAYYHCVQRALFRTYVPEGLSVLEMGCATGDLLASLLPERGVGIDLSPRMVEKARRKYPDLEFVEADAVFFDARERFDCILINNLLEYIEDIQSLLRNCRQLLKPRGRVLISTLNPLWTPVLRFGERRRLCTPDTQRNFVTGQDATNLLELTGFEVVKSTWRTLLPKKIPLVTSVVNLLAAQTPLIRVLDRVPGGETGCQFHRRLLGFGGGALLQRGGQHRGMRTACAGNGHPYRSHRGG
jgi:SAM-dependent methyltransferase